MQRSPLLFSVLLLASTMAFTGCNAFEGLYEAGSSDDPDVLVEDADFALQEGDTQRALDYLQKALENDPDHLRARAKLTVVQLRAADVDVLTLEGLVEEFRPETATAKTRQPAQECRYDQSGGLTATPINYRTSAEYGRILGVYVTLQAVQANGMRLIQALTESSTENLSASQYATAAARAQLFNSIASSIQEDSGVSTAVAKQETAAFLIAFGLSEFSLSILNIDTDVTTNQIQWVRLRRNGNDAGLSICAPTSAQIDAMVAATACEVPQLRSGGIALRTRAENLGNRPGNNDQSLSLEIANEVDDLLNDFEAEFPATECSG